MGARVRAAPENVRFAVGQISAGVLPEMPETLGNDTHFAMLCGKILNFSEYSVKKPHDSGNMRKGSAFQCLI